MGISGMILTKETYIIHLLCTLLALLIAYASTRIVEVEDPKPAVQKWNSVDFAIVCLTGIGAIVFFYSGTFYHWNGLKDLFTTFHAWLETGRSGHGHEKPPYYWLELIVRYEWPACAGLLLCGLTAGLLVGAAAIWLSRRELFRLSQFPLLLRTLTLRFLAILGLGTFVAYSIIRYKTPWCIISIIWPLLFVFGALVVLVPRRRLVFSSIVASILLLVSFGYAISLNYFRCSSFVEANWDRNRPLTTNIREFFNAEPYVYVQTYNDIYKLTTPLLELAHRDPRFYHLVGHIIRPSPYPLPWILGDFPQVGYYEHNNNPAKLDADFLLVEDSRIAEVEKQLHDNYFTERLTIRPYQDTSKLYLRVSVFHEMFPDRLPDIVGQAKN
jgi:hypothetical protein